MRYHYTKPKEWTSYYGTTYRCDHELYSECTLYVIDGLGLAVIQERYNKRSKIHRWGKIDPWLTDTLYLNQGFLDVFKANAGEPIDGLYPTLTIRRLMWLLKMKPMPRENWETQFTNLKF